MATGTTDWFNGLVGDARALGFDYIKSQLNRNNSNPAPQVVVHSPPPPPPQMVEEQSPWPMIGIGAAAVAGLFVLIKLFK